MPIGDVMDVDDAVGDWVLFNDEKVVRADETSVRDLKKLAYMYVFEREWKKKKLGNDVKLF
jgi:ubiquitin carboxyl-terminal hydrolase 5/13